MFFREYYLMFQMYFLSKKVADDKSIDLTQPEYNPQLVKRMYNFRGEMWYGKNSFCHWKYK